MLNKKIIKIINITPKAIKDFYNARTSSRPKRPILTLKRRKTDVGYIPPNEWDRFINRALGTNLSSPLKDFNGFWTFDRLIKTSISIGCHYDIANDPDSRFSICSYKVATHRIYGISDYGDKSLYGTSKICTGLTYILRVLIDADSDSMQHCILKCEETNRYITLATAISLIPTESIVKFCNAKDTYIFFTR